VKNAKLDDPALYFKDPEQALAPPPNPEQLKLQAEQQQLAAREQAIDQRRQQLDAQKAQLDQRQMMLDHQAAMAELQRKTNADKDSFAIENEKLRNELLEIKLKYSQPSTPAN
jgi:DNA-binding transcriptional MerR regulator